MYAFVFWSMWLHLPIAVLLWTAVPHAMRADSVSGREIYVMQEYQIVVDAASDLPAELAAGLGVVTVPILVTFDGEPTQMTNEIEPKEFYAKLRTGQGVHTASPNISIFRSFMEPILKEGKDVLYMGFSSGLSGMYHMGELAAEELREEYPERTIITVDTLCASLGYGLFVYHAVQKQREGATLDELAAFLEDNKMHLAHWFTVEDLFFLKRGGRISATTAVVGSMLSIKPVMHCDDEGHLTKVATVRGRKASIDALFHRMEQSVISPEGHMVYICHGDCIEDAERLANMVRAKWTVKDVMIGYTGPAVGAHSGPGTVALFFLATER